MLPVGREEEGTIREILIRPFTGENARATHSLQFAAGFFHSKKKAERALRFQNSIMHRRTLGHPGPPAKVKIKIIIGKVGDDHFGLILYYRTLKFSE
jgi:hypothetical protein